jgi:hypothetical protein
VRFAAGTTIGRQANRFPEVGDHLRLGGSRRTKFELEGLAVGAASDPIATAAETGLFEEGDRARRLVVVPGDAILELTRFVAAR